MGRKVLMKSDYFFTCCFCCKKIAAKYWAKKHVVGKKVLNNIEKIISCKVRLNYPPD